MGRHCPFDCKAACKESTVTLHSFFPEVKKPTKKALKSSDEYEKLPSSLERGWLLHKLVVFPFLLPAAISLLLARQRNQDYSYNYCCSHSFCGELGKKLIPLIKCRICLPEAQWSDVALNIFHCTDPLHPGRAVELYPFEIRCSLSTDRGFFQLQQHG